MRNLIQEYSVFSQYFAPRGKERLLFLGEQIAHRHLTFPDRLIGIVGDAGSGKSSLIKGMFPGLELSNDDDAINPRKIMQVRELFDNVQEATTYHIDMRFQMAFTQMHEIVDFVRNALEHNRRVVIEHFNLLYPALGVNADIIVGIGEEIIVTRPSLFGPEPQCIYEIVHESLVYRKMAHTVEDITIYILNRDFGISEEMFYSSDMRNGFVLKFPKEPRIDFDKLSEKVHEMIDMHLDVSYYDEEHIKIGDIIKQCNGPRFHIRNTSEVKHFSFVKHMIKDTKTKEYCLIGRLSDDTDVEISKLNTLHFLKRCDNQN
ncbi:lantibiotic ABC transporter [Solitalea longa]|uniref:Lantibiotic ABC transporter n=1 Tax=Solitalea longa TaxID=2079460 RepID=A0A2S5A202_9SPHI|nr:lantibiotic ABC transporter [Solitalea longa]POY36620.1 lantibiotic ABC transporter [Solitalea longa]